MKTPFCYTTFLPLANGVPIPPIGFGTNATDRVCTPFNSFSAFNFKLLCAPFKRITVPTTLAKPFAPQSKPVTVTLKRLAITGTKPDLARPFGPASTSISSNAKTFGWLAKFGAQPRIRQKWNRCAANRWPPCNWIISTCVSCTFRPDFRTSVTSRCSPC